MLSYPAVNDSTREGPTPWRGKGIGCEMRAGGWPVACRWAAEYVALTSIQAGGPALRNAAGMPTVGVCITWNVSPTIPTNAVAGRAYEGCEYA